MSPYLLNIFVSAAAKYAVSLHLLVGIAGVESSYREHIINHNDAGKGKHSYGLFQLQYSTAESLGFNGDKNCLTKNMDKCKLLNAKINVELGAKYLAYQLKRYNGDETRAISAYNAGSYTKTNISYVHKVKSKMNEFTSLNNKFNTSIVLN